MATIMLGGAPGANWTPLLLPVLAVLIIVIAIEYLVKFIKRKMLLKSLDKFEEQDDIRLYDEVKAKNEKGIPFEEYLEKRKKS